jgi:uncharacterized membrane protein
MSKFIRILGIALLAISAIVAILYYAGPEKTMFGEDAPIYTNTILIWGTILAGLAGILALGFQIVNMILFPKKARGSLIGILVLVVMILIGYALASSVPLEFTKPEPNNVPPVLKQVGTGLITTYILLGLGILSIIFTEVSKAVK